MQGKSSEILDASDLATLGNADNLKDPGNDAKMPHHIRGHVWSEPSVLMCLFQDVLCNIWTLHNSGMKLTQLARGGPSDVLENNAAASVS
ncbi:unnamed protein product [Dovyalis caffra]|uniref:Uncharacterized protein n=1 Tax=Dovyalis caffra TaxID=77055 RepID=A0AAV1R5U8_9ROSI|nr:unnamed protein product [Dovyalis caffra]